MTITEIQPLVLTSDDLKALRQADKIVLRHFKGEGGIEAYLDGGWDRDNPRILTPAQQRLFPETRDWDRDRGRTITVASTVASYREDSLRRAEGAQVSGFHMVSSAQYSDTWRTLAQMLRVGDEVQINFIGNGSSNGYTKKAGLHADEVRLRIKRKGQDRDLVFLVSTSVCEDNTARMVKING